MPIITLDFETFYAQDFTLSKSTTEAYVRDPRFEVIGVAAKIDEGKPVWCSDTWGGVKAFLHDLDLSNAIVVAHNALFDMAILNWHFDIRPKGIIDTLSMARPIHGSKVGGSLKALAEFYGLGEKGTEVIAALGKRRLDFTPVDLAQYGEYCKNDVELTYALFKHLAAGFPKDELKLIDATIRMFTEPALHLDKATLTQYKQNLAERKEKLLAASGLTTAELRKDKIFAQTLEDRGVAPPTKISPTTGKEVYAFAKSDDAFVALGEHEDDLVQALVAARLGAKSTIEETRTDRFIGIAERGAFPVPLSYCAALTLRWGGCLVADTEVIVYNLQQGVQTKRIVDVLLDDLVWDGEAFVAHEGVVFSGYSEVIEWDGITGTEDHVVYTEDGKEVSLRDAMQRKNNLKTSRMPEGYGLDAVR